MKIGKYVLVKRRDLEYLLSMTKDIAKAREVIADAGMDPEQKNVMYHSNLASIYVCTIDMMSELKYLLKK